MGDVEDNNVYKKNVYEELVRKSNALHPSKIVKKTD